ncbi:MAG: endonuclease NucS [Candidatus Njordarchaeia archaeon]
MDDFLSIKPAEKYLLLEEPEAEEAINFINQQKTNMVLVIFANCEVNYEGRAKSTLSSGDRIIIIKPDGTLLIHEDSKRKPVNWQPPGSRIKAIKRGKKMYIVSRRDKPKETVEIQIDTVYVIMAAKVEKGRFKLYGSEKDLVDYVEKEPEVIEEGLKILRREALTPYGYIDLVGEDQNGNTVIMEFKRGTANVSAVLQLMRYISFYEKHVKNKIRGIIVAPKITDNALFLLKTRGLEFKRVDLKIGNKK